MVLHGGSGCDGLTMIQKKLGEKYSKGWVGNFKVGFYLYCWDSNSIIESYLEH